MARTSIAKYNSNLPLYLQYNHKNADGTIKYVFPPHRPIITLNTTDCEQGFDLELVFPSKFVDDFTCPCCRSLPRQPVELRCGHMLCDSCWETHFLKNGEEIFIDDSLIKTAKCPLCGKKCSEDMVKCYDEFTGFEQRAFTQIDVKCPNGCSEVSSPVSMDIHQIYNCPLRKIACPNMGCKVIMPAKELDETHYRKCEFFMQNCATCRLPLQSRLLKQHKCVDRLTIAVQELTDKLKAAKIDIPISCRFGFPNTSPIAFPTARRETIIEKNMKKKAKRLKRSNKQMFSLGTIGSSLEVLNESTDSDPEEDESGEQGTSNSTLNHGAGPSIASDETRFPNLFRIPLGSSNIFNTLSAAPLRMYDSHLTFASDSETLTSNSNGNQTRPIHSTRADPSDMGDFANDGDDIWLSTSTSHPNLTNNTHDASSPSLTLNIGNPPAQANVSPAEPENSGNEENTTTLPNSSSHLQDRLSDHGEPELNEGNRIDQ